MARQPLTHDQITAFLAARTTGAQLRHATSPKRAKSSALVNTPTVEHNTALRVRVTAPARPKNTGGLPKRARKAPKPEAVKRSESAIHWTR